MSKERARRRAERESLASARLAEQAGRAERAGKRARRRQPLRLLPTRSPRRPRNTSALAIRKRERRAAIASTLLVVVVITYSMTRSLTMVIGVLLIASIATPALAAAFLDRSKK